jgi:DNA-directed RNA polymerase specialized sigma subunit
MVGVSQMQVSRIIRQALRTLRADIERTDERIDAA